jgi:hypothetical protein
VRGGAGQGPSGPRQSGVGVDRLVELGRFIQDQRRRTQTSVMHLAERAGIIDPSIDTPPPSVIEAIHADADLTDEQKASLVQVYESFRAAAAPSPAPTDASAPKPTVARNRRPTSEVD